MSEQVISLSVNAGVVTYLKSLHPNISDDSAVESANEYVSPYKGLGTRPDIVDRLWYEITMDVPIDCKLVVYKRATLCHPVTGIIFGYASGVPTYALRLPDENKVEAVALGAKTVWTYNDAWLRDLGREHNTVLDLATVGPGWVFGRWLPEETRWCQRAFLYAGETG